MKSVPIIPVRWINERHDTDWDGVPNYRDCNIWNPHQHGLINTLKKRRFQKIWGEEVARQYYMNPKEEILPEKLPTLEKKIRKRKLSPQRKIVKRKKRKINEKKLKKMRFSAYQIPGVEEVY